MMRSTRFGLAASMILFCGLMQAEAAVITVYSADLPGWSAAVGGTFATEDFSDATLNAGLTVSSTAGVIAPPIFSDRVVRGGASTTWSFATPITAFGGDWDLSPGGAGQGIEFTVTFFGGGTQLVAAQVPGVFTGQFFGFTSDMSMVSVFYSGGTQGGVSETYTLDNLVYAAVPEPSSLTLVGMGAIGLVVGAIRRRRQTKAVA